MQSYSSSYVIFLVIFLIFFLKFYKMKRVNLFFIAAFVAASAMFVSCGDDNDPPTIRVMLDNVVRDAITVEVGSTVNVEITFEAEAGISRIEMEIAGGTNLTGFPKTSGFTTSNMDVIRLNNYQLPSTGTTHTLRARITDKDDQTANKDIVFTMTPAENPHVPVTCPICGAVDEDCEDNHLGAVQTHTFQYASQSNPGANQSLDAIGVRWFSIPTENPDQAWFRHIDDTNANQISQFVQLEQSAFEAIKTKSALAAAYTAGTKVRQFQWTASTTPRYFITLTGSTHSLVEMTSLSISPASAPIRYWQ